MNIRIIQLLLNFVLAVLIVSCGANSSVVSGVELVESDVERDRAPQVDDSEMALLTEGNTKFALHLYFQLADEPENVFFSPFSISQALAMTYAGARGDTEAQMESVLHLPGQDMTHRAFNRLDLALTATDKESDDDDGFELNIANSIWAQEGFNWLDDFLNTLKANYGAGIYPVNFTTAAEEIRLQINKWVEIETRDKIKDLIPRGVLDSMTRMVLVNAIYFLGKWTHEFEKDDTYDRAFHRLDGSSVHVPIMHQTSNFKYMENSGYQALEMSYKNTDIAMLVILPEKDKFSEIESSMDYAMLQNVIESLDYELVKLALPKVSMDAQFMLAGTLKAMGMDEPFLPDIADFSGMNGERDLYISSVIHKAFLDIDEEGTEAAAATAVIIGITSAPIDPQPTKEFIVDRPFIFMIRDTSTNTVLFLGRILDPS